MSNEEAAAAAMMDVGSLKVAELREELAKRNLPTNGLKKDLASRLEQALKEQESKGGESSDQAIIEEDKKAVMTGKSQSVNETKITEESVEGSTLTAVDAEKDTTTSEVEGVKLDEESREKDGEEDVEAMPSLIGRLAEEEVKENEEEIEEKAGGMQRVNEKVETDEVVMAEDILEVDGPSLQDRMGEITNGDDQDVIDLGGDNEAEIEMQIEESTAVHEETKEDAIQSTDIMNNEEDRHSPLTESGLSPYSNPPCILSKEQASTSKGLSSLSEEDSKLEKVSRSIYITGLVRPLTLPAFRSKAEEFGELGGEDCEIGQDIWLDGVKTHAYVTYKEEQSASNAKTALSGSIYPPETGGIIQAYFIPQAIVKQCIVIEEQAWQKERGKVELKARVDIDDAALLYSLHRIEVPSAVATRLDKVLPPPTRFTQKNYAANQYAPYRDRSQQHMPRPNQSLQWGESSDKYGRGRNQYENDRRNDYRNNHHSNQSSGRGRYEEDRGSSRADDRVREVEARIRADRERGGGRFVKEDLMMTGRSGRQEFYNGNRQSRYEDVPPPRRNNGGTSSRTAYTDRNRDLSPPVRKRDHSNGPREDPFRRDW